MTQVGPIYEKTGGQKSQWTDPLKQKCLPSVNDKIVCINVGIWREINNIFFVEYGA